MFTRYFLTVRSAPDPAQVGHVVRPPGLLAAGLDAGRPGQPPDARQAGHGQRADLRQRVPGCRDDDPLVAQERHRVERLTRCRDRPHPQHDVGHVVGEGAGRELWAVTFDGGLWAMTGAA